MMSTAVFVPAVAPVKRVEAPDYFTWNEATKTNRLTQKCVDGISKAMLLYMKYKSPSGNMIQFVKGYAFPDIMTIDCEWHLIKHLKLFGIPNQVNNVVIFINNDFDEYQYIITYDQLKLPAAFSEMYDQKLFVNLFKKYKYKFREQFAFMQDENNLYIFTSISGNDDKYVIDILQDEIIRIDSRIRELRSEGISDDIIRDNEIEWVS